MTDHFPEHLHYLMVRHIIQTGHAPDVATLTALSERSQDETQYALRQLEQVHGVILVPNSFTVWSLHPFALMPTRFWVTARAGGWWANCAWCSLGIGAALHEDVSIATSDGAEGRPLEFRIENGRASCSGLFLHFPYPPPRWWDNPYSPCGTILFFSAESKIDAWCQRHGQPKGAVLTIETGIRLAEHWFGDYASSQWRRKTPEQAQSIFSDLGLAPPFWNLPDTFR
jgi:hypothetical protein